MVFGESLQFFSLLYSVPQFIENLRSTHFETFRGDGPVAHPKRRFGLHRDPTSPEEGGENA